MGRVQSVQFVDDLDGSILEEGDVETVHWGLDGRAFEFDTSPARAQEFRDAVARYVEVSRRVSVGNGKRGGMRRAAAVSPQVIREWARANGHDVSDRGRVPAEVVAAFHAAQ